MERRSGKGMGNGCEEKDKKVDCGRRERKWSGNERGVERKGEEAKKIRTRRGKGV
jgi:hypothetical protein